jgi:hypothetical protein
MQHEEAFKKTWDDIRDMEDQLVAVRGEYELSHHSIQHAVADGYEYHSRAITRWVSEDK